MSRKQKQYHFIYKTVNQVNGKYYIGMHSTDNLEDEYLGSGQRLWHAIRKYGKENFKREDLEFLPDRSSLKDREKEIVNEELLKDSMCMNISLGGNGTPYGATFPNRKSSPLSESHRQHISESCIGKAGKYKKTEEHRQKLAEANIGKTQTEETKEKRAETLKKTYSEKGGHSEDSRQKMSENRKGKGIGNPGRKGQPHSEESNRKNAESHRGKVVSVETRNKISEYWEKRRLEKLK